MEKLATWANGEEVTEAAVDQLVAARADSPPWNLTDAWGQRNSRRPARRRTDARSHPDWCHARSRALVGSLTIHVRRARAAQRLEARGLSAADAAAELGVKPYPAQKLYAQVRNFSASSSIRR